MPKFNQELQVTVDVDMVAQQLLNTMKEDNPHRELLTYNIVGHLKEVGKLGSIFSALAGYHKEINAVVGKTYECLGSDLDRTYNNAMPRAEWDKKKVQVTVLEINPFTLNSVKVSFQYEQTSGDKTVTQTAECSVLPTELIEISKTVGQVVKVKVFE